MKKKILFIIPSLTGGGAEKVLVDVLQNMNYEKYDVTLCLKWRTGPYLKDIPHRVTIVSVHGNNNLMLEHAWKIFKKIHLCYILKKLSLYGIFHACFYKSIFTALFGNELFDTIISFMEGEAVKYHSYIVNKAKKNISWIHIDLKKKHWSLDFFRNSREEYCVYQQMEKIICVSEDVKKSVAELYPNIAEKCNVIYNPIDREKIIKIAENRKIHKRKFTICMVGRLNEQKRYDKAIEIAYKLRQEGYEVDFWILGDGELYSALNEKVKEYQLEDSFLFMGFVKPPYSYMKTSDLYLSTSVAEGFSLALCEAFCLGVPAVCTRTAGTKELIGQSSGGLLTNEDIQSIYESVKRMIDDEFFLKQCGQNALSYSQKFDIASTMKQIYQIM